MWKGQCLEIFYFLFFLYLFSLLLVILRICQQKISANSFERIGVYVDQWSWAHILYCRVEWFSSFCYFRMWTHYCRSGIFLEVRPRRQRTHVKVNFLLFYFFLYLFGLRGSSPSLPRDFTVYTVSCPQSFPLWEMPDSNPGPPPQCRLERDQWATTSSDEPPHLLWATTYSYFQKIPGTFITFFGKFSNAFL